MPQKLISKNPHSYSSRPLRMFITGAGFMVLATVWAVALPFSQPAQAYYDMGRPKGYVTDTAKVLSSAAQQTLEKELTDFEAQTSHQIAVVTIPSLQGDTIEGFAAALFKNWNIGKKTLDNGVLFLVAVDDRKARIEVGYGIEGALPDVVSKAILEKTVFPRLKQGNFDTGIAQGVLAIENALKAENATDNQGISRKRATAPSIPLNLWLFFIFIFGSIFVGLGKTKSWWAGGIVGGIAGVILFAVTGFLAVIVISIVLGLAIDYLLSSYYKGGGPRSGSGPGSKPGGGFFIFPGGWGGNSGGGWGGGFGGFGGGRSGGGGASGSW